MPARVRERKLREESCTHFGERMRERMWLRCSDAGLVLVSFRVDSLPGDAKKL